MNAIYLSIASSCDWLLSQFPLRVSSTQARAHVEAVLSWSSQYRRSLRKHLHLSPRSSDSSGALMTHRVARYLYFDWCTASSGDSVLSPEQYRSMRERYALATRLEALLAQRFRRAESGDALPLDEEKLRTLLIEAMTSANPNSDVEARVSELELLAAASGAPERASASALIEERSLQWKLLAPLAAQSVVRQSRLIQTHLYSCLVTASERLPPVIALSQPGLRPTGLPLSVHLECDLRSLSAQLASAGHSESFSDLISFHKALHWEALFERASHALLGLHRQNTPPTDSIFDLSLNDHYLHFFQTLW